MGLHFRGSISRFFIEGHILRFFSVRGDLCAVFPVVAKLADQIKRASDENSIVGRGLGDGVVKGVLGVGDHGKMNGMVAGDFGELHGGNGARSVRRGEDHFGGVGKEQAGDFVDSFVAKSGVNHPNFAGREILLQEICEFAGGAGIVRAVEINVGCGLQSLEAAGPDGFSDAACDGFVGDLKSAVSEEPGGSNTVQGVLKLESARQARSNVEGFSRGRFDHLCADASVVDGFLIDAKDFRGLDNGAAETFSAIKNHFAGLGTLFGEDERHARFKNSRFFSRDFREGVAEKILVVEIDTRDDGDDRRQDVGGIQAAAEADFEDREFHPLSGKVFESHGGDTFEISRVSPQFAGSEKFLDQEVYARQGLGEGCVANLFTVNANAFVDFFKVRRGV